MTQFAALFDGQRKVAEFPIAKPATVIDFHGAHFGLSQAAPPVFLYQRIQPQPWQERHQPLVSAIMPTQVERRAFLPQAFRCWFEQDYPKRELIVVGERGVQQWVPDHPHVVFRECAIGDRIGKRRNMACEWARGEVVIHWDDDDVSAPNRISEAVRALSRYPYQVTGYRAITHLNTQSGMARAYRCEGTTLHGNSLAYSHSHWRKMKGFDETLDREEDTLFLSRTPEALIHVMDGGEQVMTALHHGGNTMPIRYTPEWRVQKPRKLNPAPHVILGMVSWNRADVLRENVQALLAEAERLERFGYQTRTVVVDNGSTDGSANILHEEKAHASVPLYLVQHTSNRGSAVARNEIASYAKLLDLTEREVYVMYVDCDVTVVPGAALALLEALRARLTECACVGLNWESWTAEPGKASDFCYRLERLEQSPALALTQCGMFQAGLLLEYPFDENFVAGWGGEDNDWAMQVEAATGLICVMSDEARYLHREAHKSVRMLEAGGMNVAQNTAGRYEYLIRKWEHEPRFRETVAFFREKVQRGDVLPEGVTA